MIRLKSIYRERGGLGIFKIAISKLYSKRIRSKNGYSVGFYIDYSCEWLADSSAMIGEGFRAGRRCRIETVKFHNGVCYIPRLIVGKNVAMNDDVHIGCVGKVKIGDNVLMASKIYISDHNHGSYKGERQDSPKVPPNERPLDYSYVEIADNVWIGEGVVILPGVIIGEGSIIGSNSVVTKSIPNHCIAVGSPAKVVKIYNFCKGKWESIDE